MVGNSEDGHRNLFRRVASYSAAIPHSPIRPLPFPRIWSQPFRHRKGPPNECGLPHLDVKSTRTRAHRATWGLTLDVGAPSRMAISKWGALTGFPIGRNLPTEWESSWRNQGGGGGPFETPPMRRVSGEIKPARARKIKNPIGARNFQISGK